MRRRYLEVTFRSGRPLAAYLYLPRPSGAKVVRTADAGRGVKIDYEAGGTPIGVEITAPAAITAADLSAILLSIGVDQLEPGEWAPLAA
jgi:uncharacterized protein YuzE